MAQTRPEAFHYAWPSLTHGHTLYTINHIDYDLIAHMQNVHARTRMNGIPIYSYSKWGWFYIMFSMLYLWIISGGLFTPPGSSVAGQKKVWWSFGGEEWRKGRENVGGKETRGAKDEKKGVELRRRGKGRPLFRPAGRIIKWELANYILLFSDCMN